MTEDTWDTFYHEPAMPMEVVRALRPESGGVFLDLTIGGAGHAERLLLAGPAVRVIGLDQDAEAIGAARQRLARFGTRVTLVQGNFRDLDRLEHVKEVDGIAGALMDLGVSSQQMDSQARGFSFRSGTPLLMTMGRGPVPTAADLLNNSNAKTLGRVFRDGEERRWRALSREVVKRRKTRPFHISDDLVSAQAAVLKRAASAREKARLFQALRMAVNDELPALKEGLDAVQRRMAAGARLAVLSWHSLEDRVVKQTFTRWASACECPPKFPLCRCEKRSLGRVVTRRPLRPQLEEIARNPRARSARLRVWQDYGEPGRIAAK